MPIRLLSIATSVLQHLQLARSVGMVKVHVALKYIAREHDAGSIQQPQGTSQVLPMGSFASHHLFIGSAMNAVGLPQKPIPTTLIANSSTKIVSSTGSATRRTYGQRGLKLGLQLMPWAQARASRALCSGQGFVCLLICLEGVNK